MFYFFTIPFVYSLPDVVQVQSFRKDINSIAIQDLEEEYSLYLYLPQMTQRYWGSGIVIEEHYVLTNAHVVSHAQSIQIFDQQKWCDAELQLFLPKLDMALLYIPDFKGKIWNKWADGNIGQVIFMGGYPQDLLFRQETGSIVSVGENAIVKDEYQYFTVIEGVVSQGFSGGAVWNEEEQFLGMITAVNTEMNQTYMISASDIALYFEKIDKGILEWGDLGIEVKNRNIERYHPMFQFSTKERPPLGQIISLNGKTYDDSLESIRSLHADLHHLESDKSVLLEILTDEGHRNWQGQSQSILQQNLGMNLKDACFWAGMQLWNIDDVWVVGGLSFDGIGYQMGIEVGDAFKGIPSCEILQEQQGMLKIHRSDQAYWVFIPKIKS